MFQDQDDLMAEAERDSEPEARFVPFKFTGLTAKQERYLHALLELRSVQEACVAAGVNPIERYQWSQNADYLTYEEIVNRCLAEFSLDTVRRLAVKGRKKVTATNTSVTVERVHDANLLTRLLETEVPAWAPPTKEPQQRVLVSQPVLRLPENSR